MKMKKLRKHTVDRAPTRHYCHGVQCRITVHKSRKSVCDGVCLPRDFRSVSVTLLTYSEATEILLNLAFV